MARSQRIRLRPEHAEHSASLRVIALGTAWCSGLGFGVASGDLLIALILTVVITAGHLVSWRTRLWRSARWQLVLLAPTTLVGVLLVPSLPLAFHGDWVSPMRYLLLLQALSSFYLHSRASLYTAQVLSAVVLMVASQLAISSAFLFLFFGFFVLLLVFLATATRVDARTGAIGSASWPGAAHRYAWTSAGLVLLAAAGLGAFLVLPWGSITVARGADELLPLTGAATQPAPNPGGDAPGPQLPLTGQPGDELTATPEAAPGTGGPSLPVPGTAGEGGGELGQSGTASAGLGGNPEADVPGAVPGDTPGADGVPDPIIMQVRSPVATYWRGQTHSLFDGFQWLPDGSFKVERARRTERLWYTQTFVLRAPQEFPTAGYTALDLRAIGGALDDGTLDDGDVYRVTSERRDFHPATLFRSANNTVVNRGPDELLPARVRDLAGQITAGTDNALDKALAITQYLRTNYQHLDAAEPWAPAQTTEQFLFGEHRSGNAFDFAAAQTALAVAAGLEARLVTGYLPGERDPLSGTYVVRASDAHAWTEINFRGASGWVPFDGNPREDGRALAASRGGAAGAVAGLFERRVGDEVRQAVMEAIDAASDLGWLLQPMGAVLLVATLAYVAFRLWRRRRKGSLGAYTMLPGAQRREVLRAYRRLERALRGKVPPRGASETVDAYFTRLQLAYPPMAGEVESLRAAVTVAAYKPRTAELREQHVVERMTALARLLRARRPSTA